MRLAAVQALVVADMQEDFFNDSELRRCRADLVTECNRLSARAQAAGTPVFLVHTMHAADRSTWSLNMLEDGEGMTIADDPGSDPVADPLIEVHKTRDNAFFATELQAQMESRSVRSFALCGVSTESCIAATAADAYARDFQVALVDRATASIDEALHDHTLRLLSDQYRQPVLQPEVVRFVAPPSSFACHAPGYSPTTMSETTRARCVAGRRDDPEGAEC